jgi:hypothetical protein
MSITFQTTRESHPLGASYSHIICLITSTASSISWVPLDRHTHNTLFYRLYGHVLTKGAQIGATVGTFVVAPLYYRLHSGTTPFPKLARLSFISMAVGTGITGFMLVAKMKADVTMTEDGVKDRAYRIHHNAGQNRIDRYSLTGATAATLSAVTYHLGRAPLATALVDGLTFSSVGVAAGVALYGLTSLSVYVTKNPDVASQLVNKVSASLTGGGTWGTHYSMKDKPSPPTKAKDDGAGK